MFNISVNEPMNYISSLVKHTLYRFKDKAINLTKYITYVMFGIWSMRIFPHVLN